MQVIKKNPTVNSLQLFFLKLGEFLPKLLKLNKADNKMCPSKFKICAIRCGSMYYSLWIKSTAFLYVCFLLLFYHTEMQTLELPSENKMYMGDFEFCFATGLWCSRTEHSWGTQYSWNLQMIKWGKKKGKRLHCSVKNWEQLCSCSQIVPTNSVTSDAGSKDIKSLLTLVLD